MLKKPVKNLRDWFRGIFHPRWKVSLSNWEGGRFKIFRYRNEALAWAKKHEKSYLFIDIKDQWTDKDERLKDNPDDVKAPPEQPPQHPYFSSARAQQSLHASLQRMAERQAQQLPWQGGDLSGIPRVSSCSMPQFCTQDRTFNIEVGDTITLHSDKKKIHGKITAIKK